MSLEIAPEALVPPLRRPNVRRRWLIFWLVLASIPFISMGWAMAYGYSALLGLMVLGLLLLMLGLPLVFLFGAMAVYAKVFASTGSRFKAWAAVAGVIILYVGVHVGLRAMPVLGPIVTQTETLFQSTESHLQSTD